MEKSNTTYHIPYYQGEIPRLTTEQMIEVDRLMIEEYNIELIQMMENAGRGLAILAKSTFLQDDANKKPIIILAGTGGNGGGALVCGRRLASWGYPVKVYITDSSKMTPIPQHQLNILHKMNIPAGNAEDLMDVSAARLIIDGIIGYSISGNPFGAAKTMIAWANGQPVPTLSLDTPSGINLTSGTIYEPAIRAEATLTLALPKEGLFNEQVKALRGKLYLADISVPPELYRAPSLEITLPPIFRASDILRVD